MSNIVILQPGATLPAYMMQSAEARKQLAEINSDVITGQAFPSLSIKGKVFAIVRGDERKVLTREDDPDAAVASVNLAVVRANSKSRVFFAKQYVEGEQGPEARPDCASADGIVPLPGVQHKQSDTCAVCPQAVWGTRVLNGEAKGTACTVNTRMAVFSPENPTYLGNGSIETFLLRAPAASRAGFAQVVSAATGRGIPYNALVLKVSFEMEAATPKLVFKPIGFLTDEMYAKVKAQYDDDLTKDMMGLRTVAAAAAPTQSQADKDIAALNGQQPPAGAIAAPVAPTPTPAPTAAPVAPPAAAADPFAGMEAAAPAATPAPTPAPRARRARAEPAAPAVVAANDAPVAAAPAPTAAPAPAPAPVAAAAPAPVAVAAPAQYDDLLGQLDSLLANSDD